MAIADATLQYLVENKKCRTLFITHYPLLATKLGKKFPSNVQNLHMNYDAEEGIDGLHRITFLYKLVPGLATGKEVASQKYRERFLMVAFLIGQHPLVLNAGAWQRYQRKYFLWR